MDFVYNNKTYSLILFTLAGSRLYGTSTEDSDWDYRGVFIAPPEDKLGMFGSIEQINSKELYSILKPLLPNIHETDDITLYEIKKFVKLAADNNPNIMDILFADEESILYIDDNGKELLENKHLFISKKAKFTFSGYAYSQMKRLRGHKKWINKYPDVSRVLENIDYYYEHGHVSFDWIKDYFGGDVAKFLKEKYARYEDIEPIDYLDPRFIYSDIDSRAYIRPHIKNFITVKDTLFRKLNTQEKVEIAMYDIENFSVYEDVGENTYFIYIHEDFKKFGGIFSREGNFKANPKDIKEDFEDLNPTYIITVDIYAYKAAVKEWSDMWSWKINRNFERSALEDKLGYDAKHASHLVRLMIGAEEILTTGTFNPRYSGNNLIFIKKIRSGKIKYEKIMEFVEDADKRFNDLYETSKLQKEPRRKEINKLLIKLSM